MLVDNNRWPLFDDRCPALKRTFSKAHVFLPNNEHRSSPLQLPTFSNPHVRELSSQLFNVLSIIFTGTSYEIFHRPPNAVLQLVCRSTKRLRDQGYAEAVPEPIHLPGPLLWQAVTHHRFGEAGCAEHRRFQRPQKIGWGRVPYRFSRPQPPL